MNGKSTLAIEDFSSIQTYTKRVQRRLITPATDPDTGKETTTTVQFNYRVNSLSISIIHPGGGYPTYVGTVRVEPDGNVAYSVGRTNKLHYKLDNWRMNVEETAELADELKMYDFPRALALSAADWTLFSDLDQFRQGLRDDKENVFPFWTPDDESPDRIKKYVCLQHRIIEPNGRKRYLYYTHFSDGKWRVAEPEGFHRIYGLGEAHADIATRGPVFRKIFVHEGAKAARGAYRKVKAGYGEEMLPLWPGEAIDKLPVEWFKYMKESVHIGWCGGVEYTEQVDLNEIVRLAERCGAKQIIFVADADGRPTPDNHNEVGLEAAQKLSVELSKLTFDDSELKVGVLNLSKFGFSGGWDFADPMPADKVREGHWLGHPPAQMFERFEHATHWITVTNDDGEDVQVSVLNDKFVKRFLFMNDGNRIIDMDKPDTLMGLTAFEFTYSNFFDRPKGCIDMMKRAGIRLLSGYKFMVSDERAFYDKGGIYLNSYIETRPDATPCTEKDIQPFLSHMQHTVPDEQERNTLMNFIATVLIHPDRMFGKALVLHGKQQGTGKSLVHHLINRFFGGQYVKQGDMNNLINGKSNDFLINSFLVYTDEISMGSRNELYEVLKQLITSREVRSNIKYQPETVHEFKAKLFFTSNSSSPLFVEREDRRFIVCTASDEVMPQDLVDQVVAFYENPVALGKLRYWMQENWRDGREMDKFGTYLSEGQRMPETESRRLIIERSVPDWAQVVERMMYVLKPDECFLARDLNQWLKEKKLCNPGMRSDTMCDTLDKVTDGEGGQRFFFSPRGREAKKIKINDSSQVFILKNAEAVDMIIAAAEAYGYKSKKIFDRGGFTIVPPEGLEARLKALDGFMSTSLTEEEILKRIWGGAGDPDGMKKM